MNAGLLACTDTDGLTIYRKANRIGLRIFQRDQRHQKIALGGFRQGLIFRYDFVETFGGKACIVTLLRKTNAEYFLGFCNGRLIGRIDLNNIVVAVFLLAQDG